MDVLNMSIQFILIAYEVLPKPPLPYTLFLFLLAGSGKCHLRWVSFLYPTYSILVKISAKIAFDQTPACRKIRVVLRQRPKAMKVIR